METPSAMQVYSESWSAARGVLASCSPFYWIWIAAAALVGALSLLVPDSILPPNPGQPQIAVAIPIALTGFSLMIAVLGYFVLADAVRAFVPAFRFTVPVFFLAVVVNMLYSFAIQFAMYCFVIPAFYIGPKLWLWMPNFLLTSDESTDIGTSLTQSWRDTDNLYWPTFALMALITISACAILLVAVLIASLLIEVFHPLAILATPLLLGVSLFVLAQIDWAWLRWAVDVR